MLRLSEICIDRPVLATMLVLVLVVAGVTAYLNLGLDRFPPVDLPTVEVRTHLPGTSAEVMEIRVTDPIEEAVGTVAGIREIRSISTPGTSHVSVLFELTQDIDVAAQEVREHVAAAMTRLPRDVEPPRVFKLDNEQSPVLTVALSGNRPLRELTELADRVVKIQLDGAPGVGEVRLVGGRERSINVWVDADRLVAYRIPISLIHEALLRQHVDSPGGHVTRDSREQTLRTMGHITDPREFDDLVITVVNGAPIRVRDIGFAEDGTKEQRSLARVNGEPAVVLEVLRQGGANTVAVIEGAHRRLEASRNQLPADVQLRVISDQSRYIYLAQRELRNHLLAGTLLICIVVFLFLKSVRPMLIAALSIPVSLITTFAMMWLLGFSINSVTLLALVLMVGVVVDDSIVVLENVFRHVEEKRRKALEAARAAMAEIGLALVSTTLTLILIFVPVSFMSSVSGRFLFQFGLTAAVASVASLFVAFTLVPSLGARVFSRRESEKATSSRLGFYNLIDRTYTSTLRWALSHPVLVLAAGGCIILSAIPLYQQVLKEYTPSRLDEGEFEVVVRTPQGVSITAMDEVMHLMETEIARVSGVETVFAAVGEHLSRSGSLNQTRALVRLIPHEERRPSLRRFLQGLLRGQPKEVFEGNLTQREVMEEVRDRLSGYPDLRVSVRNIRRFNIGGTAAEIDFNLLGPELDRLLEYAEALRTQAPELGLVDAVTTLQIDQPELRAEVDRARASALGVRMEDIAAALRLMVGGDPRVSRFRDPATNLDYDIQLRLMEGFRSTPEEIAALYVPTSGAGLVALSNLVSLRTEMTASRIDRLNRRRQVSLRAQPASGYALADRLTVLREAAHRLEMPVGYTTAIAGGGREMENTLREFLWAFIVSGLLLYIVLGSLFESFLHPLTILLSLLVTIPFALLTLWIAGETLNIFSAMGVLVLFGVALKNAILQIDCVIDLRTRGLERAVALVEGCRSRLRPILMTTLTFIVGMIPLALGTGPGAEERRAAALVIIYGQSLALLVTLLVTPVTYMVLDEAKVLTGRVFRLGLGSPEGEDPREEAPGKERGREVTSP